MSYYDNQLDPPDGPWWEDLYEPWQPAGLRLRVSRCMRCGDLLRDEACASHAELHEYRPDPDAKYHEEEL